MDLALNNLQRLICHKTQQTKPNQTIFFIYIKTKQKTTKKQVQKRTQTNKNKKNPQILLIHSDICSCAIPEAK